MRKDSDKLNNPVDNYEEWDEIDFKPQRYRPDTYKPKKSGSKLTKILTIYAVVIVTATVIVVGMILSKSNTPPHVVTSPNSTQAAVTPGEDDTTFEPYTFIEWTTRPELTISEGAVTTMAPVVDIPEAEYIVNAFTTLNVRDKPTTVGSNVIRSLYPGAIIKANGKAGSFYRVKLSDGTVGYCHEDYLMEYDSTKTIVYVTPDYGTKEGSRKNTLVDIRSIDPTIKVDMLLYHDDSWPGKALYRKNAALLQEDFAKLLAKAQAEFMKDGYCIVLQDAYRSPYVQTQMYNIVKNNTYVQNPNNPSNHQYGIAVDMTLEEVSTGKRLEMPSKMHTFDTTASATEYGKMTAEAEKNVRYMQKIMQKHGFQIYKPEWWHFNPPEYMTKNQYILVDYWDLDILTLKYVS